MAHIKLLEMNSKIFEMKTIVGWINSRPDIAEEKISELGDVQQKPPNGKQRDQNKQMNGASLSCLASSSLSKCTWTP